MAKYSTNKRFKAGKVKISGDQRFKRNRKPRQYQKNTTVVPSIMQSNNTKPLSGKNDIRQTTQILRMSGLNSPYPTRTLTTHMITQDIMVTNVSAFGFSRIPINRMATPFAALITNPIDTDQYFFPTIPNSPQGAAYFISNNGPYRQYQVHKFKMRYELMNSDPKDHGRLWLCPISSSNSQPGLGANAQTVSENAINSAYCKWTDYQAYANKIKPAVNYSLKMADLEGKSKQEYNSEEDYYGRLGGGPTKIAYMYWGYTNDTQASSSEAPWAIRITLKYYVNILMSSKGPIQLKQLLNNICLFL